MNAEKNLVVLGRFGKAQGIKGFIRVHSFTEPRENLLDYAEWRVFIDKQWQIIKILQIDITPKLILAKIDSFETREQVGRLTNLDIFVPKDAMPVLEKGEFYWHELIGLEVINQAGEIFGKIVGILPTGSNDVLVVEGPEKKQILIPYLLDDTIVNIDILQQKMFVDWDLDY